MPRFQLRLTPHGRLRLEERAEAPELDDALAARLTGAFGRSAGHGLLQLGGAEVGQPLPPVLAWWRDFAMGLVGAVRLHAAGASADATPAEILDLIPPPTEGELASLLLTAPMMPGAEYLHPSVLLELWRGTGAAFADSLAASGTDLQNHLAALNPVWNLVGRVHFSLAENRRDPDRPFAFMATYTTRPAGIAAGQTGTAAKAEARHQPLGQALRELAGTANRKRLLSLLLPVQRAAQSCGWLEELVDSGEIFHPLRWSAAEARRFLDSVPDLEGAGLVVRMPAGWRSGRPARPRVAASVGAGAPSGPGLDALLDFRMDVTLEGEPLTKAEMATLLAGTDGLVLLRGRWVEIDRERLQQTLDRFAQVQDLAEREGLSFAAAMRLLAGAAVAEEAGATEVSDWAEVTAGPWLANTLARLRSPDGTAADPGPDLKAELRPYQKAGVAWLRLLSGLGLGACLADDMGLGKTIQVLALLLIRRREDGSGKPALIVAPASLLANWAAEAERFAPGLDFRILHGSASPVDALRRLTEAELSGLDLAITSYGALSRLPVLEATRWSLVVLDEAQAIKNPNARQSRAAKSLKAEARIALTGTPVENHAGDLWSIFDFINPGLLGSAKAFGRYTQGLAERAHNPYGPLRDLVRPYILRRMKTDRTVIQDLPEKTEVKAWCPLSRKQAALYAQSVAALAETLEDSEGMQRRGLVLATLMRLKQICNHPSQWLGDGEWAEADSGKWQRLREIAATVAARQEKMLVFTQFREMAAPLAGHLAAIFGRPGIVLHGGTRVKARKELVQRFQEDEETPFFVLSLKAGGAGLNLTAAAHVVHFDRWWNPAVENQATDRAFRIGQKRNVLVHKFVCRGTVEEKIDALLAAKQDLADDLLAGGGEIPLTEMTDKDLLDMITLDLKAAMAE